MLTCSQGILNMLNLALAKGATFLQTSTSECYGDPLVHPQIETYWGNVNPIGIRSPYDEGKRFGEAHDHRISSSARTAHQDRESI